MLKRRHEYFKRKKGNQSSRCWRAQWFSQQWSWENFAYLLLLKVLIFFLTDIFPFHQNLFWSFDFVNRLSHPMLVMSLHYNYTVLPIFLMTVPQTATETDNQFDITSAFLEDPINLCVSVCDSWNHLLAFLIETDTRMNYDCCKRVVFWSWFWHFGSSHFPQLFDTARSIIHHT